MATKTIKINNIDYTSVSPEGYHIKYAKIRGGNSRYAMDGSYKDDVRAVKSVITWQPMPLLASNPLVLSIIEAVQATYINVYYLDPYYGYKTIQAMPSEPDFYYKGAGCNGDVWVVSPITFTEV